MDGILGKALSPFDSKNPNKDRTLFFSPLSSVKMGKVSTSVIRNQTTFISDTRAAPDSFTVGFYLFGFLCPGFETLKNGHGHYK